MSMNQQDWGLKYRPTSIEDVLLPTNLRNKLNKVINQKGGLSLLFWGRSGCGKTSVAKLINPMNTVFINCSTNNSIDMVRWLETEFNCGMVTGGRRLLLLDEADNLTNDAQAAIRAVSEELALHNDFVLTANDPNKLSEALRSRFLPVQFDLSKNEDLINQLVTRLDQVATLEGHQNTDINVLKGIVERTFPDLRRMIKTLQFEII